MEIQRNMKIQIIRCSDDSLFYNKLKFPVKTEVIEASVKMLNDGVPDSYNVFWNRINVRPEDCYYSEELKGFILKSDCCNDEEYLFTNSTAETPIIPNYGTDKVPIVSALADLFKEQKQYEINKDRVYDSGARRDGDDNKPYVHNLQGYVRLRFGYHTRLGASKYGDGNFLLGMPSDQALQSLDRHLAGYLNGDRSEDHLSAIIFGCQLVMLNEQKEGVESDYYFKLKKN